MDQQEFTPVLTFEPWMGSVGIHMKGICKVRRLEGENSQFWHNNKASNAYMGIKNYAQNKKNPIAYALPYRYEMSVLL
jgi:hypothetical protein